MRTLLLRFSFFAEGWGGVRRRVRRVSRRFGTASALGQRKSVAELVGSAFTRNGGFETLENDAPVIRMCF